MASNQARAELFGNFFNQSTNQFWGLQLLGWLGWVSLFFIRDVYWGQPFERISLLVVDAAAGFLLTTALRYFYHLIWEKPIYVRIIGILAGSYLVAAIWQPVKNGAQFIYYDDFRAVEEYGMLAYFNGLFGYSYFLILGWSGLYFGLKFARMLQEEQQRSIKAESMAHEAQLRMLRYQLNPHFLFNTLNAISTLILEKNTSVANEMVSKLSNFLRYSLDKDPMQKVDLDHELNTMKLYLEIEQVRFDDRLKVEINVSEEAAKALVPSLILQPLVENSIKYAIASRIDGGTITINASLFVGDLLLEVIDDGPGLDLKPGEQPSFGGVGLANTCERLAELYRDQHSCKFLPVLPHGLKVEIRIPYERA
ncbi:MAG: sensor histidine kinase [Pseudomonadales bacterium]